MLLCHLQNHFTPKSFYSLQSLFSNETSIKPSPSFQRGYFNFGGNKFFSIELRSQSVLSFTSCDDDDDDDDDYYYYYDDELSLWYD